MSRRFEPLRQRCCHYYLYAGKYVRVIFFHPNRLSMYAIIEECRFWLVSKNNRIMCSIRFKNTAEIGGVTKYKVHSNLNARKNCRINKSRRPYQLSTTTAHILHFIRFDVVYNIHYILCVSMST